MKTALRDRFSIMSRDEIADVIELFIEEVSETPCVTTAGEGFSGESDYKNATNSGMVNADTEMAHVLPSLSNVVFDGNIMLLNGDEVKLVPKGTRINLVIGAWAVSGRIKTEIAHAMIKHFRSTLSGVHDGWEKFMVQYKEHVITISIKDNMSSFKLLKFDYIAQRFYEQNVMPRDQGYIGDWKDVLDETEAIYGSAESSMPTIVDDVYEEAMIALETLERCIHYDIVKKAVADRGWTYV